jgi:general secretion pathway protein D
VVGRFFASDKLDRQENDVIVALIPRIVRAQELTRDNLRGVASGTESIWKMNYSPRKPAPDEPKKAVEEPKSALEPPAKADAPASPPAPPSAAAAAFQAAMTPQPLTPQAAVPAPGGAPLGGPARLLLRPSANEVVVNGVFTVDIVVENVRDLFSAPMRLRFDGQVLELTEVLRGDFLAGDGQQVTFTETKFAAPGGAVISLNRVPGAGGMSGSGTLVTLKFRGLARGPASIAFEEVTLRDSKLVVIDAPPPSAMVAVR